MKLLFISNLFPDRSEPRRGLDNATVLHHLAADFEIRVLALRPSLRPGPLQKTPRDEDRPLNPAYLRIPYLPKIGSPLNHRLAAWALRGPLARLRKEFAFDVALASWIYPDCCAVSMLAQEFDFPFVAIAQGSDVHQYLRMPSRRRIITRWLPGASSVITRSAELSRLLGAAGLPAGLAQPVYNGIDFARFQPADRAAARQELKLPPNAPLLLFVGNLLPIKNPQLLVRAHAVLCTDPRFAECRLVLLGDGPLAVEIRALADAQPSGKHVILAGPQPPAVVARYMQAANALCLPSHNEGVPNVILEAFACGLPVVASRVGGIPEIHVGEFLGDLPPPNDLAAWRGALQSILEQPRDPMEIARHAQNFTWEKTAVAYRDLLLATARGQEAAPSLS